MEGHPAWIQPGGGPSSLDSRGDTTRWRAIQGGYNLFCRVHSSLEQKDRATKLVQDRSCLMHLNGNFAKQRMGAFMIAEYQSQTETRLYDTPCINGKAILETEEYPAVQSEHWNYYSATRLSV